MMKRQIILGIFILYLSVISVFCAETVDLKTELVFEESEKSDSTIFSAPNGIAVDSSGNIYISDAQDNCIKKFGPGGKYLLTVSRSGKGPGEFSGVRYIQIIDSRLAATEFSRRQFFDLEGKYIKTENQEVPKGFAPLMYYNHGRSYVGYLADLRKSKYILETGEYNSKTPLIILELDAGRNARIDGKGAKLLFTVYYYFDADTGGNIYYTGSGENRDVIAFREGKSQPIYKTKGTPVKASPAEIEQKKMQREKYKDYDIPEIRYHSIIKDLKCYRDNIYIWIETEELYGWVCLDNQGKEIAFYWIDDKSLINTLKTEIANGYIYYLIIDPEKGAIIKKSKI